MSNAAAAQPAPLPRPAVTAGPLWRFPEPEIHTLDNGVALWQFQLPGQHLLALDLVMGDQLSSEPASRFGVATMAMRLADEGTDRWPEGKVTEALEQQGASYAGHVSHDGTICSMEVPADRFAKAWEVMWDIITAPSFTEVDTARHVALRLTEIEQARIHPSALAGLTQRHLMWDHTSRWDTPSAGFPDTVAPITSADVQAWHREQWRPQGATVIVAGDLPAGTTDVLTTSLSGWQPSSAAPQPPQGGLRSATRGARVVHLVDRPGAVQAEVRVCASGPDRSEDDWPAFKVGATVMGSSFLSRLNRVLREERGFTYGVHLSPSPSRIGGTWTLSASCRTDVCAEALSEGLRIVDVETAPFRPDEVADAITQLVGVAPLRYQTADGLVSQAAALANVGVDSDHVNRHFAAVGQVDTARADEAWKRWVRLDDAVTVVVGDAEQLTPSLVAHGFTVVDQPLWF